MYLKSCCALFLLALVACQAAPSSQAIEKSINEAETFANTNIELEGTGAEKDRAKKSATTFCVEVRSGKPEKIPCTQEIRPQGIVQQEKPVVIVQPISIPASVPMPVPTIVEYPKQPVVIHQHPQPQVIPQPAPQFVAPPPSPVPVKLPASAPATIPIIDIVPPTPASTPCDKPTIVQPTQSQVHTVHVIHSQPTPQPSKIERPMFRPIPQQSIIHLPTCKKCNKLIPPLSPKLQPIGSYSFGYPTAFTDVISQYGQSTDCEIEPTFECNCRPENRIVEISPHKIKIQDPRMVNAGATIDSIDTVPFSIPHTSSMISREHDPSISNIISDQPLFFAPKGARETEGKHSHHRRPSATFFPVNVEFPVAYGTDGTHNYQPQYYPSYPSSNSYTYPSSYPYGAYETYGTSYPVSYNSLAAASNVPAITVNAGGPFYNPRESQLTDSSSQSNNEAQPRAFSTDIQSNYEQKEITQTDKESIIKEIIPETNVITKK